MWLRVNLQNTLETYRTLLTEQQIDSQVTSHPQALGLAQPTAVQHLPCFADGGVTVQDLHAQWAALLLQPQNGELDFRRACAAPGAKLRIF